jgi:hypothetical protein
MNQNTARTLRRSTPITLRTTWFRLVWTDRNQQIRYGPAVPRWEAFSQFDLMRRLGHQAFTGNGTLRVLAEGEFKQLVGGTR